MQQVGYPVVGFPAADVVEFEDQADVVADTERRHEIESLVDEADMAPPEQRPFALRHRRNALAGNDHFPGIR